MHNFQICMITLIILWTVHIKGTTVWRYTISNVRYYETLLHLPHCLVHFYNSYWQQLNTLKQLFQIDNFLLTKMQAFYNFFSLVTKSVFSVSLVFVHLNKRFQCQILEWRFFYNNFFFLLNFDKFTYLCSKFHVPDVSFVTLQAQVLFTYFVTGSAFTDPLTQCY